MKPYNYTTNRVVFGSMITIDVGDLPPDVGEGCLEFQQSGEKNLVISIENKQNTGCFIGILIMVYFNPRITR